LDAVNLEAFRDRIDESIANVFDDGTIPRPRLKIDSEVELHEIDRQFIVDLNKLAPFGAGNPEPTLLSRRSKALNVRVISNKHLRARFKDESGMIEGFGFAMRDAIGMLDDTVAIAFVPRLVSNRGESKFEVQLKGVRPSELVFENEP
jgi:single-stranded-DNA-specific exonuclease